MQQIAGPAPAVAAHAVSCVVEIRYVARRPENPATMLAWVRGRPFPNAVAFRNVTEVMRTPPSAGQRQLLEPTLYTVEGRQVGNLRGKCASALSRKAKPPGDRGKGRPFFAGAADTPRPAPQRGIVMRRILVVDDDMRTRRAVSIWLAPSLVATRSLRKRSRPAPLLAVIDECLSEAEQRRKLPTPSVKPEKSRQPRYDCDEGIIS